jgi:hypothetical protein
MKNWKIIEDDIEYCVVEYDDETKIWYLNNQLHRENGPAVETPNGYKVWCKHDKYHRTDGPAVIWSKGKEYWLNNRQYYDITSDEEWLLFQIIT